MSEPREKPSGCLTAGLVIGALALLAFGLLLGKCGFFG